MAVDEFSTKKYVCTRCKNEMGDYWYDPKRCGLCGWKELKVEPVVRDKKK